MVKHLPAPLLSALTGLMLLINLLATIVPFFAVTLAKFVVPLPAWRRRCSATLVHFAEGWIDRNSRILAATQPIRWDVRGLEGLSPQRWYLVLSNRPLGVPSVDDRRNCPDTRLLAL